MNIKLKLPLTIEKDEELYVAVCQPFSVASQGKTEEDAIKNVKEALELYLNDEDVKLQYHDKIEEFIVPAEGSCVSVEINGWQKITPSVRI